MWMDTPRDSTAADDTDEEDASPPKQLPTPTTSDDSATGATLAAAKIHQPPHDELDEDRQLQSCSNMDQ